jgi:hypothetical protein
VTASASRQDTTARAAREPPAPLAMLRQKGAGPKNLKTKRPIFHQANAEEQAQAEADQGGLTSATARDPQNPLHQLFDWSANEKDGLILSGLTARKPEKEKVAGACRVSASKRSVGHVVRRFGLGSRSGLDKEPRREPEPKACLLRQVPVPDRERWQPKQRSRRRGGNGYSTGLSMRVCFWALLPS